MNKVCKQLKNYSASTTIITEYHSWMTGVKVYKYHKLGHFFSKCTDTVNSDNSSLVDLARNMTAIIGYYDYKVL